MHSVNVNVDDNVDGDNIDKDVSHSSSSNVWIDRL